LYQGTGLLWLFQQVLFKKFKKFQPLWHPYVLTEDIKISVDNWKTVSKRPGSGMLTTNTHFHVDEDLRRHTIQISDH
jgi:hypothetical protein